MPTREQIEHIINELELMGIQCRWVDKLDRFDDALFDLAMTNMTVTRQHLYFDRDATDSEISESIKLALEGWREGKSQMLSELRGMAEEVARELKFDIRFVPEDRGDKWYRLHIHKKTKQLSPTLAVQRLCLEFFDSHRDYLTGQIRIWLANVDESPEQLEEFQITCPETT
jgi:hypothetical protein